METNLVTEQTKVCSKCKQELPISHFNGSRKSPDGLQYYCKECVKEANNISAEKRKNALNRVDDSESELSQYTPRQLMEELKRRGFTWDYMLEPQRKIYFNKI